MSAAATPKLIVRRAGGDERVLHWGAAAISVGRDGGNDIVIDHPLASRRHARFELDDDGYAIRDLDSTNGTLFNQEPLRGRRLLRSGDEVQIADALIVFEDPGATIKGRIVAEALRRAAAPLRVDDREKAVYIHGELLDPPLTVKEFQLLELLHRRPGQVYSKDEIAQAVWDYEVYDYNAIDALIYRLRQRIEPDPTNPTFVVTQRGFGYKLVIEPR
jgi:pSer/pThr/pTyr-binding forkhead associated (FHA) protein